MAMPPERPPCAPGAADARWHPRVAPRGRRCLGCDSRGLGRPHHGGSPGAVAPHTPQSLDVRCRSVVPTTTTMDQPPVRRPESRSLCPPAASAASAGFRSSPNLLPPVPDADAPSPGTLPCPAPGHATRSPMARGAAAQCPAARTARIGATAAPGPRDHGPPAPDHMSPSPVGGTPDNTQGNCSKGSPADPSPCPPAPGSGAQSGSVLTRSPGPGPDAP